MEEGTKNFLIGLMIGLVFLVVLLFPLKAIASLFFGKSAACIDDASKSSIDIMVSELNVLGDNVQSETPIKFGKGNCIFAILDKNANNLPGIAPPLSDMINKNELCICEYDEAKNSCTKNYYCKELSFTSISLIGFDKKYVESEEDFFIIYYEKEKNKLTISKTPLGQLFDTNEADVIDKQSFDCFQLEQRAINLNLNYYDTLKTGGCRGRDQIDLIVLHHTGSSTFKGAYDTFIQRGLSVHYIVDKDGTIYYLTPENKIAWHAKNYNTRSIGIEIVNTGNANDLYTSAQYDAIRQLIQEIVPRYPNLKLDDEHIKGHYQITDIGK